MKASMQTFGIIPTEYHSQHRKKKDSIHRKSSAKPSTVSYYFKFLFRALVVDLAHHLIRILTGYTPFTKVDQRLISDYTLESHARALLSHLEEIAFGEKDPEKRRLALDNLNGMIVS